MIELNIYNGLKTTRFNTSESNIRNLYFVYYGWPINAAHRTKLSNPIHKDGNVVLNSLKRQYKELQKTLINERFIAKIQGIKLNQSYIIK